MTSYACKFFNYNKYLKKVMAILYQAIEKCLEWVKKMTKPILYILIFYSFLITELSNFFPLAFEL